MTSLWRNASVAGILAALASCSAPPEADPDLGAADGPEAAAGELRIRIADFADGRRETRYFLRNGSGKERRLLFQDHPDLEPGARLTVWGAQGSDAISVDRYEARAPKPRGSLTPHLINPTPQAPRIFCPVLVTINNGTIPSMLGLSQLDAQFHTAPTSVNEACAG